MVFITEQLVRKKSEHNELLISTLEELSLHQEDIERIEHLQNWCRELKILLLQSNLIPKIENLHKLKKLEYLNLALNNIERIENLEGCESLHKLDLTLNFISELTSVESLRGNYNLKQLILMGNPCADYKHYRDYVIATLPQLELLDCTEIKLSDRLKAKHKLKQSRAEIVQQQADYAIERDEQIVRVRKKQEQQREELAAIEDEEERNQRFWNTVNEHCPETRIEMAEYTKKSKAAKESGTQKKNSKRKPPMLFAPNGRPYCLNQPQLPFKIRDERTEYILELDVYKHLDTSLIDAEVESNYIRVTVKGKIFQFALAEEVKTSAARVQRSQITGQLVINAPKLKAGEVEFIAPKETKKVVAKHNLPETKDEIHGTVDITSICPRPKDDEEHITEEVSKL